MSQADLHGVSSGNTGPQAGGQQAAPLPPLEFTEPRRYELQPLPPLYGATHVRAILQHLHWDAVLDGLEGGVAVLAAERPPTHGSPPTWTLTVNGKEVVLTDTLLLEEQKQQEAAAKKKAEDVARLKRRYDSVSERLQAERADAARAGRAAKSQASGAVGRTGRGGGAAAAAKQHAQQAQQRVTRLQKDLEKIAGSLRELGHDPAPTAPDTAAGDGVAWQSEMLGLRRLLQEQDARRQQLEEQVGQLQLGHNNLAEQASQQVSQLQELLGSQAQEHGLHVQRVGDRLGRQEQRLEEQATLLQRLQERKPASPPATAPTQEAARELKEVKVHLRRQEGSLAKVAEAQQSLGEAVPLLHKRVGVLEQGAKGAAAGADLQRVATELASMGSRLEEQGRAHAAEMATARKGWEASRKALEDDMRGQLAQRDAQIRQAQVERDGLAADLHEARKAMLGLQGTAGQQEPLSHLQALQLQAEVDKVRADLEAQRALEQRRLDAAVAELRKSWEAQQGEAVVCDLRLQTERLGVAVKDLRASCEAQRKEATAAQQLSAQASVEQGARLQGRLDEVCGELREACEAQMVRLQQAGREEGEKVQRQLSQQASELGQSWQGLLEGVRDAEEGRKRQHQEMLSTVKRELGIDTRGRSGSKGAKGKAPPKPAAGPAMDAPPAPPAAATTPSSSTTTSTSTSTPAPPGDSHSKPVTPVAPETPATANAAPTPAQPAAVPPAAPAPPAQPAPPAPPLRDLAPTADAGDKAPPGREAGASRNGRVRQASITAYLRPRSNRLTPYPQKQEEE